MGRVASRCDDMAEMAEAFCRLVDAIDPRGEERAWWLQMRELLPRLHMAVIALGESDAPCKTYSLPDDEQRFELYIQLNHRLQANALLGQKLGENPLFSRLCERLADDLTDMYFDLRRGLELLQRHPAQPQLATGDWQSSFYQHWGHHLLDAERWLYAVDSAERAPATRPWVAMSLI